MGAGLSEADVGFSPRRLCWGRGDVPADGLSGRLCPGSEDGRGAVSPGDTVGQGVCSAGIPLRWRWPPRTPRAGTRGQHPLRAGCSRIPPSHLPPPPAGRDGVGLQGPSRPPVCPAPKRSAAPSAGADLRKEPAGLLRRRVLKPALSEATGCAEPGLCPVRAGSLVHALESGP